MNEQLTQNNVQHSLINIGVLNAGEVVLDPLTNQKMLLSGFVPCYMELKSEATALEMLNMNEEIIVSPFRLRCKNGKKTYPIMSHVELVHDSLYATDDSCLALTVFRAAKYSGNNYTTYLYLTDSFQKEENSENIYKSENPLFVFTRNIGQYKVVSEMFLCLCRYINPVTGLQNYFLVPPEQIVIIKEKSKID